MTVNSARNDYLAHLHEADTQFMQQLVATKSILPHEEDACALVQREMEALKLEVIRHEFSENRANIIGILRRNRQGPKAPTLLFNGHLDTNAICTGSEGPPEWHGWTVDPLGGDIRHDEEAGEDCLYGIGASNMKSSDAAYMEVVRALCENNNIPRYGDIIITYVVGELQNGIGTHRMLTDEQTKEAVRFDYGIVGEPTELGIFTKHTGTVTFRGRIQGDSKHISRQEEAVDAGIALQQVLEAVNGPGRESLLTLQTDYRNMLAACVGSCRAGLGDEMADSRPGQIPDTAVFRGSFRHGPDITKEEALATLRQAAEASGMDPRATLSMEIEEDENQIVMPPLHSPANSRLVRLASGALKEMGLDPRVDPPENPALYGSDTAHLREKGRGAVLRRRPQLVMWGSGGKFNTQVDERVPLSEWRNLLEAYGRVAFDLTCTRPRTT